MTPEQICTSNKVTSKSLRPPSPGKPDPEQPVPGRVQIHSENDREGYSGHGPGPVHEVGTKRQVQMELGVKSDFEGWKVKQNSLCYSRKAPNFTATVSLMMLVSF